MSHQLLQFVYIGVFFLLPGVIGAWIAYGKGRNVLLWFLLNALFPPTLMITIVQGPVRPVPGHYRQCPKCRGFNKWREQRCKYCQSELSGT